MGTRGRGESEAKLETHLGFWLRRVSNHVSGEFARSLGEKRTSVAEWVVLCRVEQQPGVTPGELAEALDLTRGAVSKVVDKLDEKGWVERREKVEDSRVQLLHLTRAGTRVLPELAAIADENDERFFGGLDAGERAALRRLLGRLAELHGMGEVPMK